MATFAASTLIPHGDEVVALAHEIGRAPDITALTLLAPRVRELASAFVELETGAAIVNHLLSGLNDRVSQRAIALVERRHRLPAASWCWLAMGSEGRVEQTFATDQDNGLVFSAADHGEAAELRRLFVPFAREVNEVLASCGFPLCAGGIMAGNDLWCLSVPEWRRHFTAWIHTPEPEALLNATIFFDLRGLHGDPDLAATLRGYLQTLAPPAAGFLRMMAGNALDVAPPLGKLRDFAFDEGHPGRIDLKKHGARLFVDAARVFALAAGVAAVNTPERLRAAGPVLHMSADDTEAAVGGFRCLQRIRLQAQHQALCAGEPADNLIDPDKLNRFDRRLLMESLKQARHLQVSLKQVFRIDT
jgi:CBS domain-containing protein